MEPRPPELWVVNQIDRYLSERPFQVFTPDEVLEGVEWVGLVPLRKSVSSALAQLSSRGLAGRHLGTHRTAPSVYWAIPPMRGDEPRITGQEET